MALYQPPTRNGLQKTLDSQLDEGVTASMTLNNVTGVQAPGVVVINRIDTNNAQKAAALREYVSFTGISGNTLTGLTRALGGSTDQDHAVGSVVEFVFDVVQAQAVYDALLKTVTTAGVLDTTKVVDLTTAQTLTNKTLTAPTVTSPVINTGISGTAIVDEDDMTSDSATKVPTQQSVKAYVDAGEIRSLQAVQSGAWTRATSFSDVPGVSITDTYAAGDILIISSRLNFDTETTGIQVQSMIYDSTAASNIGNGEGDAYNAGSRMITTVSDVVRYAVPSAGKRTIKLRAKTSNLTYGVASKGALVIQVLKA